MNKFIDQLVNILSDNQLFEMAYNRRDYMNKLFSLTRQLLENWCLIRYCSITNRGETKNHWKSELRAYLMQLNGMTVKLDKTKITRQQLIKYDEANKPNKIYNYIAQKFEKENIDIDSPEVESAVNDCSEYGIDEMIDIICESSMDKNKIKLYLDQI